MKNLSRRDFLKLTGVFSTSAYLASSLRPMMKAGGKKKILILLFDAMSARHLSLYAYPRNTTPELSRFAANATVFHSHYSAANFTSPSTASLFLGMYPWTHRAYTVGGLVRRDLVQQNLFALFGDEFFRFAFAQTQFANILMDQFAGSIDRKLPPNAFSIGQNHSPANANSQMELLDALAPQTVLEKYLGLMKTLSVRDLYTTGFPQYPKGIPVIADNGVAFQLEDVFRGVFQEIQNAFANSLPHISYQHLFAPHEPYKPGRDFLNLFQDDYKPLWKPKHPLSTKSMVYRNMVNYQRQYDQYIAHVDHEFGLLMTKLEKEGLLEDTYVVVTSDHGELFERATTGHAVPFLFESVIRIPLLIRAPGQSERVDIHAPTSNVDLYPTLLKLFGREVPPNIEAELLPGFGGEADPDRTLYSMYSPRSSAFAPLRKGTFAIVRGEFKLIYYKGYKDYPEAFELYNIHEDPDEIKDLFTENPSVARRMKDQLLDALGQADEPYK
jgi:arylsulfatase A-like enzyme